jgi:uncharacterized protein YjiK
MGFMSACNGAEKEGNLQLKLPKDLREISGLSALQDGSLLAVADEQAQVYQIDMAAGVIRRFLAMGSPVGKGDFEGIAVLNKSVYLVTSQGTLWRLALGASAHQSEVIATDAGERCEIEGLTAWHEENSLLLLCKTVYDAEYKNALVVLRWSEKTPEAQTEPLISKTYTELGLKKLHPSGLAFSVDRQNLFIVAARQKAFVEISLQGQVVRHGKLPKGAEHRQTEGVAITRQNRLYLADEGGKGHGTLTEYASNF